MDFFLCESVDYIIRIVCIEKAKKCYLVLFFFMFWEGLKYGECSKYYGMFVIIFFSLAKYFDYLY